jgi:hypothetical protein
MFKKILFTLLPDSLLLPVVGLGTGFGLRQRHTRWEPNGADLGRWMNKQYESQQ